MSNVRGEADSGVRQMRVVLLLRCTVLLLLLGVTVGCCCVSDCACDAIDTRTRNVVGEIEVF